MVVKLLTKLISYEKLENLSASQGFLVQACLSTNKEEQQALVSKWEELIVMDDIDYSSMRLVPLFLHKNQLAGITTKYDKRLKVIYKYWWLKTQHLLNQVKKVYEALHVNGIKAVFIKGSSMITHYEQPELRPMADFDLLIKPEELGRALNVLKEIGYSVDKTSETLFKKSPKLMLAFDHSIDLVHTVSETKFDLHWQMGSLCSTKFADDYRSSLTSHKFVPGAEKAQLAYEVFFTIIHAVTSYNGDNLNWIIDIDLLDLTPHDWSEVQKIATMEKKVKLLDYGCAILLEYGVNAPRPLKIIRPRLPGWISIKTVEDTPWMRLIYVKLRHLILSSRYLFPYSNVIGKLYHGLRHAAYKKSKRELMKATS